MSLCPPSKTDSAASRLLQKIVRKRRGDAKWLICQRMRHFELSGVQHRPHGAPGAIEPVACQRVSDGREVHADLVRAAGLERDREERAVPCRVERLDVREGALAVFTDGEFDRSRARDRRVDGLLFPELALAQR